jgi:adenosylmethionine---8-amino-7-oxononanoate aminotransferase
MDRTETLRATDKRVIWHPFTPQQRWTAADPLIIERGEGCWLVDTDGHAYLDGVSSLWTNVHGHAHPRIDAAVREQLDRLAHSTLLGLTHPPAIELAAQLVDRTPEGLDRVFYSDSGSTATEIAVKMAFQAQQHRGETGRTRFATLSDAYHGDTLGAVSVGAISTFHRIFEPLLFRTEILPAPRDPGGREEAGCLERALTSLDEHADELAALIVEPLVQGAAGMKMHSEAYLRPLLERAREHGLLLIADEVAVGFGRTGTLFAMEQVGITPDFLCLAKGISGGYLPLAATLTSEAVYDAFLGAPEENRQFFHGHTYTGNPLACAAALASLELLDENDTLAHISTLSAHLAAGLEARVRPHPWVARIRQRGVLIGIDLEHPGGGPLPADTGHRVCMATRAHGLILRPLGNTLIINPPLALSTAEADQLVGAVRAALNDVAEAP